MAARSIASLSLTFGLVSIPVKVFSGTESKSSVSFNMLAPDGSRVKQQYVSAKDGSVVERSQMIKGYEFEDDKFVTFTKEELKALEDGAKHTVDIEAFVPEKSIDPIYYDKAYLLAPDKRGAKPYALLAAAMRRSGRVAIATWASKGKQYPVQIRPAEDGLVLQQLLYADEVRSLKELNIEQASVSDAELQLALQIIEQIAADSYDPSAFKDTEKQRILAAIDQKIAGRQIVLQPSEEGAPSAEVIDLVEALKASLAGKSRKRAAAEEPTAVIDMKERKGAKRAAKAPEPAAEEAPARKRARK
jgi:DNA end-binding protein Ku